MLENIMTIFDEIVVTYRNQQQKEKSVVSNSLKYFSLSDLLFG
jgi:hypothetical protein